jgi:DNA-binding transcriptional ArsR family regulator
MDERYRDEIAAASRLLVRAVIEKEPDLGSATMTVDAVVRSLLRGIGRATVLEIYAELSRRAVAKAKDAGLGVHRSPVIAVMTLFGVLTFASPYLRDPRTKRTQRPLADLGLRHGTRTPAVERALTDFGAEESFGQAAKRFQEHYGFEVGRTTVLRVVERHAAAAQAFVHERLEAAQKKFDEPLATRPGVEPMLVELDGCEIRTGTLRPAETDERSPVRGLPKRVRDEAWRDVRVGLARPVDELEPTYVAGLDTYDNVVHELFGAACERGLSSRTKVFATSDGGNGLREALDAQFAGLRFILDRPHLRSHLFDTADAIGLHDRERDRWVAHKIVLLDTGHVQDALRELRAHKGRGKKRVGQLLRYLTRFHDALAHDEMRAAGLPVGSGEVESAHRTIPQKRLKLPGAWWRPDTVGKMLGLRVLRANDWWDPYWEAAA